MKSSNFLGPAIQKRQQQVKDHKLQNLLYTKHFVIFGNSVYVQSVLRKLVEPTGLLVRKRTREWMRWQHEMF